MIIELPTAEYDYKDWTGTSFVDWHIGREIYILAKEKGVDIERYFPIGLKTYGIDPIYCSVYGVDTTITNKSIDDISTYAESHHGILPIVIFNFISDFDELQKYIRKLSIVFLSKFESISSFDQLAEIELD